MQTVDPSAVGMDPERIEHLFGHSEKIMTSGLIEEPRSITRWHVLSDLAQACVVE